MPLMLEVPDPSPPEAPIQEPGPTVPDPAPPEQPAESPLGPDLPDPAPPEEPDPEPPDVPSPDPRGPETPDPEPPGPDEVAEGYRGSEEERAYEEERPEPPRD